MEGIQHTDFYPNKHSNPFNDNGPQAAPRNSSPKSTSELMPSKAFASRFTLSNALPDPIKRVMSPQPAEPSAAQLQLYRALKNRRSRSQEHVIRAGRMRWVILLLSCFIMFGNYYAFDNPSALNRHLRTWMKDPSEAVFQYNLNLLYTVYSVPNIFLPFMIGRALDRFSSRSFLVGLSIAVCLGQAIFALGVEARSWPVMFLGRFVFGLGGESLAVAQSRLVTEWFMGQELALALGLNLSIARIGTVANNNISPRTANGRSVTDAALLGLLTCMLSLLSTLVCIFVDVVYRPESDTDLDASNGIAADLESSIESLDKRTVLDTCTLQLDLQRDIALHPSFWLLMLINFSSYGAVLCFNNIASAYLQSRYYPGQVLDANLAMSLPDSLAIFLVPALGFLVDFTGSKLATVLMGQGALAIGHLWLATSHRPARPFVPLGILGIGYSTLLAIWSCVPNLAGTLKQATAYGFLTASTNFSVTVLPMVVAALIAADQSYFTVGLFFSSLGLVGFVLVVGLATLDRHLGLGLNRSCPQKQVVKIEQFQIHGRHRHATPSTTSFTDVINRSLKCNQISDASSISEKHPIDGF